MSSPIIEALDILWVDEAVKGCCRAMFEDYYDCLGEELQSKVSIDDLMNVLEDGVRRSRMSVEDNQVL